MRKNPVVSQELGKRNEMPNWCENRVDISGEPEYVRKFMEHVGKKFDFQKIIPMPKELEDTTSPVRTEGEHANMTSGRQKELLDKYGFDNWYDWALSNWGTKWPADGAQLVVNKENYCRFMFMTAWCPPAGIYRKVKELFPDLSISWFYDEQGMQFTGYLE